MRTADVDILLVPGRPDPSPDHWISRWERSLRTASLVTPPASPTELPAWSANLAGRAAQGPRPSLIVAHGAGASLIADSAGELAAAGVIGAIIVAPLTTGDPHSSPQPLAFPSIVIASRTSPDMPFEDAADLARAWGAEIVDAGEAGGIDDASGHGPWPEGLMRLGWFLKRIASTKLQ